MSVRTCVWLPAHGDVGHSSIYVGSEYLSFWPAVTYKAAPDNIPLTDWVPSRFHTYNDDAAAEGSDKHFVVILNKLDEARMMAFIRWVKAAKPRYHMKEFNCTTVVKIALYEGSHGLPPNFKVSADPALYSLPAGAPMHYKLLAEWMRSAWNPWDLHRYAAMLKRVKG